MPSIRIPRRFNGPPKSGNGGYSGGALARYVHAPAVEVTLRAAVPLARELQVELRAGAAVAVDGDTVIAEARPTELRLEAPAAIPLADAVQVETDSPYRDTHTHPFATCFVCGPRRTVGDGLRMFPGPHGLRTGVRILLDPEVGFAEPKVGDGHTARCIIEPLDLDGAKGLDIEVQGILGVRDR